MPVFTEKGYEAATMTEIAARAGAPIGSLYQFFPVKAALADTLVENYIALLAADLQALEARANQIDTRTLVESLFGKQIAAILRARAPTLNAEAARELAIVILQLMKASNTLGDEQGLPSRAACLRELRALAVQYLDQRLP
jgi:AcrR family transcriptional regulator